MRFVKSFVNSVSILTGGLKFQQAERVVGGSADIVSKESDLAGLVKDVKALTGKLESKEEISIVSSEKGLTMRLPDSLMFDLGIGKVSTQAVPILKKIGAIISRTSYAVRIEGHTDNVPIRTPAFASNWELSTARAVNVLRYFVEKEKVSPERLSAVGFGEFQPIAPNDTPRNRAMNRRVEIVFARHLQAGPKGGDK